MLWPAGEAGEVAIVWVGSQQMCVWRRLHIITILLLILCDRIVIIKFCIYMIAKP